MVREQRRIDIDRSAARAHFLGTILEQNVFPFPKLLPETSETLSPILEAIDRQLQGRREDFRYFDKTGDFPPTFLQGLRDTGVFGISTPREFGGKGLPALATVRVLQQIARYDLSAALLVATHLGLGVSALLQFGNEAQKKRYLPRLASGETIGAFCLSEPGSGSDAQSIMTSATKNPDGSWTLNGEKNWVTNGGIAGMFVVFARTESSNGKITAFLVDRGLPGISVGPRQEKLGVCAASVCTVAFQNVRLTEDAVLGIEGSGFKTAMMILNYGRHALAATCVGSAKEVIRLASGRAAERKQFGKNIAEFGLVQEKLGAMTVGCFAAESTVALIAHYLDAGVKDFSIESAIAKVFATEMLWNAANDALSIAGGSGVARDLPYERILRDARMTMIFQGTNEILRLYIGLAGTRDVSEESESSKRSVSRFLVEPIKSLGFLSELVTGAETTLTTFGAEKISAVHPALRDEAAVFAQYTSRLHQAVELMLSHFGKNLIDEQFHLKRAAEIAMDLFSGMAVLSRVSTLIENSSPERCATEMHIARVYTATAKRRMNYNLRRMITNEDADLKEISNFVVSRRGYVWDTLD